MMESRKDEKQEEIDVINESKNPLYKIDKEDVHQQTLKKQEADLQDSHDTKYLNLQAEVTLLEQEVENGATDVNLAQIIDSSIRDSEEKLHSAKMELASVLRETLKLKRKIDSFPVQSELIQYELRFSELNRLIQVCKTGSSLQMAKKMGLNDRSPLPAVSHTQEKHCQTRNLYSTYNALLEIKELMLKEISLLNSINSQFHDAIASPAGQMKLTASMEGILKGTQQRLRKAELEIQKEQTSCDAIKERHTSAVLKQRQFHSLLKTFQEECANNERLRTAQTST